jgi:hypothetical protein
LFIGTDREQLSPSKKRAASADKAAEEPPNTSAKGAGFE